MLRSESDLLGHKKSSKKKRVTFDRQVLGKVVFPEKRKRDPNYAHLEKIHAALREGRLHGYICESIGTLEAIEPDKRAEYFANRIPQTHRQMLTDGKNISVSITIKTDHNRHPGLHERLVMNLRGAQALGIRLLYVPIANVQLPKQFLNDQSFYESRLFEAQTYADRFAEVAATITACGVGSAAIVSIVERFQQRSPVTATAYQSGMQVLRYANNEAERTVIAKAIAEWPMEIWLPHILLAATIGFVLRIEESQLAALPSSMIVIGFG